MKRYILLSAITLLFVALAVASLSAAPMSPARMVVCVRDITPSYCCLKEADQKIREVVAALGPGDRFVLIELGSRFTPERSVKVIATLPLIPAELTGNDQQLNGLRERTERLNSILARCENNKQPILRYLERPVMVDKAGTDVFGMLRYAAGLLNDDPSAEKYFFVASDLYHDVARVKASMPPAEYPPLIGARVAVLFMPYGKDWDRRKKAWMNYFSRSGALDVQILDAAVSRARVLLPRSSFIASGLSGSVSR